MEPDWIGTQELIAAAKRHGNDVSSRTLELWRYRGLLPRGEREPQGRAAWRYPPIAEIQLLRLLRWRKRSRSHDLIRIALWVEGFDVAPDAVRTSIATFTRALWRDIQREVESVARSSEALEALARKLATSRGKLAIPRVVRMTTEERTRACAVMLAYVFNLQDEIARRSDDLVLLQRMLGLRSGRGGGLAAALAIPEEPPLVPSLRSPAEIEQILAGASDEELEFVRRFAHMLVVWMPLLVPVLADSYGAKGRPMVEIAERLYEDPRPEYHAFLVAVLLIAVHARGHNPEALRGPLADLTPGGIGLQMLAMFPPSGRRPAFDQLPPLDQTAVAQALQARRSTASEPRRIADK
jgi:hypothetical protein